MKEERRSRKRFQRSLWVVTALLIIAGATIWGVYMMDRPYDRTRTTYADFVVEEGSGIDEVSEALRAQRFIRSASHFRTLARLTFAGEFKPGTYYLSPSMNSRVILKTLQSGLTTSKGFTVPPGYTVAQLAAALDRDGLADLDKFLDAAASPDLASLDMLGENPDHLKGADLLEGFLLPGEYSLSADADEPMMIIMMLDAFNNFYNDDYRARADELGVTTRQLLVIASLVEEETTSDRERAAISGVIHNQINLDMINTGDLPKKPLCSPSKESIIAALYPDESEYTHYVLDPSLDGTHRFTSDEAEYEEWTEEYEEAIRAAEEETEAEEEEEDSAPMDGDAVEGTDGTEQATDTGETEGEDKQ